MSGISRSLCGEKRCSTRIDGVLTSLPLADVAFFSELRAVKAVYIVRKVGYPERF